MSAEGPQEPFSRRMGYLDIPMCFLNLVTGVLGVASTVASDITMLVAAHANYSRDEREFRGMVKNYDDPNSVGARVPEPED